MPADSFICRFRQLQGFSEWHLSGCQGQMPIYINWLSKFFWLFHSHIVALFNMCEEAGISHYAPQKQYWFFINSERNFCALVTQRSLGRAVSYDARWCHHCQALGSWETVSASQLTATPGGRSLVAGISSLKGLQAKNGGRKETKRKREWSRKGWEKRRKASRGKRKTSGKQSEMDRKGNRSRAEKADSPRKGKGVSREGS